jgi:hypothetical protein
MKRINSAWINGVVSGIAVGVLMAYISWESSGRQGKLTDIFPVPYCLLH